MDINIVSDNDARPTGIAGKRCPGMINCKKKSTTVLLLVTVLFASMMLGGCRRGEEEPYEEQNEKTETPMIIDEGPDEDEPYIDLGPRAIFTGLPIDEEIIGRRPMAVVLNNNLQSWPHSGMVHADVIYEVLAEGGLTRLVGIFQSQMSDKIGPARSARDYLVDFALNHDAIFVHHSHNRYAMDRINYFGVDRLDGFNLEGVAFLRDATFPEWSGITGSRMWEHSGFFNANDALAHIANTGMRGTINEALDFGFSFGEIAADIEPSGVAMEINIPFSGAYPRTFRYDEATGLYLVYNHHGAYRDAETGDHVGITNILVQITSHYVRDEELGVLYVTTVGKGPGYFAVAGEKFAVTWEKSSHTSPMRWYFENGDPLILSPGKTWINVFSGSGHITFE